jgi:hypothetical protein
MNCVECFCQHGQLREAMFVLNGQSVCQAHAHVVVPMDFDPPHVVYRFPGGDAEPKVDFRT